MPAINHTSHAVPGLALAAAATSPMAQNTGWDLKANLYRRPVDMRRGCNGLAALVRGAMQVDPSSGALLILSAGASIR